MKKQAQTLKELVLDTKDIKEQLSSKHRSHWGLYFIAAFCCIPFFSLVKNIWN